MVHHENLTTPKRVSKLKARAVDPVERALMALPVLEIPEVERQFLYVLRASCGLVKIGQTTNPRGRFNALRLSSPLPLDLVLLQPIDSGSVERIVHCQLGRTRAHGEWFRFSRPLLSLIAATQDPVWPVFLKGLARQLDTYTGALALRDLLLQHVNVFGLPHLDVARVEAA